jgi:hypothetical protein
MKVPEFSDNLTKEQKEDYCSQVHFLIEEQISRDCEKAKLSLIVRQATGYDIPVLTSAETATINYLMEFWDIILGEARDRIKQREYTPKKQDLEILQQDYKNSIAFLFNDTDFKGNIKSMVKRYESQKI